MRVNTVKFYRKVQSRCTVLYNVQRLRYDDVIEQLMDEYDKSEVTINRILRTELPIDFIKDAAQLEMFAEIASE